MGEHPIWFALTATCLMWYTVVTVYVAIRGGFDIRHMLDILKRPADEEDVE